jgi:hypothetical protein
LPGDLNRSTQHFIFKRKDGVWRWIRDFVEGSRWASIPNPLFPGIPKGPRKFQQPIGPIEVGTQGRGETTCLESL